MRHAIGIVGYPIAALWCHYKNGLFAVFANPWLSDDFEQSD